MLGENVLTNEEILLGLPALPQSATAKQRLVSPPGASPNLGLRHSRLELAARKWQCRDCGRQFRQRLPGILPGQHATEPFREAVFRQHLDGINRSRVGKREHIGAATVERHFRHGLQRHFSEKHSRRCPPILGIDEHFFTRRKGCATTLCDLKNTPSMMSYWDVPKPL